MRDTPNFKTIGRSVMVLFLLLSSLPSKSQVKKPNVQTRKVQEYKSAFQISLFPGISTNGIRSGSFYNQFSLNFFGGLSRGSGILELGFISNANIRSTTGIQLAGFANIIGANAFVNLTSAEENAVMHQEYESNSKGIQFAGLLNYVRSNAATIQLTGGFNVVGNDFKGVQVAGIGNSAGGFTIGFQMAGLYNIGMESYAGVQLTSLFNYTDGQLSGTQISLINKARIITGKKSSPPTKARGLQIGLVNFCKAMDGVQIGLINFGGDTRGKQIGLINFFSRAVPTDRVRNGTPIGLLNYGSKGSYFRFYTDEVLTVNIEYSTGNCLNCSRVWDSEMPFDDRNQIFNQNALILGYDPLQQKWGFGYGFQKVLFNKVTMEGSILNKTHVITYGLKFLHLNRNLSLDRSFNLLNRLNLDYGKRWRSMYVYAGVSLNCFLHGPSESIEDYKIRSIVVSTSGVQDLMAELWPGYEIGLHF